MVYAILYAFLLGYGLSLGENVYVTVDPSVSIKNPEVCPNMPSKWFNFLLVPVFSVCTLAVSSLTPSVHLIDSFLLLRSHIVYTCAQCREDIC